MLKNFLLLVAAVLLISALLTPSIHSLILLIWPAFDYPFSRVFDRVAMLVALLLILGFRKHFPIRAVFGYFSPSKNSSPVLMLLTGLLLTFLTSFVLMAVLVHFEVLAWRELSVRDVILSSKFIKIVAAALLISVIEETFFRGLLLSGVGSSRVDLQACKLEYSIVSPK